MDQYTIPLFLLLGETFLVLLLCWHNVAPAILGPALFGCICGNRLKRPKTFGCKPIRGNSSFYEIIRYCISASFRKDLIVLLGAVHGELVIRHGQKKERTLDQYDHQEHHFLLGDHGKFYLGDAS